MTYQSARNFILSPNFKSKIKFNPSIKGKSKSKFCVGGKQNFKLFNSYFQLIPISRIILFELSSLSVNWVHARSAFFKMALSFPLAIC